MKTRRLLLLSLLLNAVLAGVVAWAWMSRRPATAPSGGMPHLTNRPLRVQSVAVESPPQVVEVAQPLHWREVESTDYRVYLQNLRAIGCPERTVREIIVADVNHLFLERLREVFRPLHLNFWLIATRAEQADKEFEPYEAAVKTLRAEREAVFEALFGDSNPLDYDSESDQAEAKAAEQARWNQLLDFLPPETQERVRTLDRQYHQTKAELWKADHELSKDERAERKQRERELAAEQDRQLATILAPKELAEYRLRTSGGADLRERLTRVEFAEDEIRAIVRLQHERQQLHAQLSGNTPETRQRRAEIQQQAEAQLKQVLGEARYADYQRANDHRFEQISQVVERYGLPEDRAREIYAMAHTAEAQASASRQDNNRSAEERHALLQAIRAETERSVQEVMGAAAFKTLQQRGGASWLDSLSESGN